MGAENFGTSGVEGKRQAKRARVLLAAKLETPGGTLDVRLRDLSRKGALVECQTPPAVGTKVTFVRGSTRVPARVAWTAGIRIGLEFLTMIDESEVLVQLGQRARPQIIDPVIDSGAYKGLRGKEEKLIRAWGVQVGINLP